MPVLTAEKVDNRPIMRFRVLRGLAIVGKPHAPDATPEELLRPIPPEVYGPRGPNGELHPTAPCGDIVESRRNLVKLHGADKFERVFETATQPTDEYDAMSIEELQAMAEENEIDVGRSTSQKGIANKVRQAMEG